MTDHTQPGGEIGSMTCVIKAGDALHQDFGDAVIGRRKSAVLAGVSKEVEDRLDEFCEKHGLNFDEMLRLISLAAMPFDAAAVTAKLRDYMRKGTT